MAEPDALARALDQPRHVGDGELAPVGRVDRPEHRLERRERVLRDLRLRVRDPAEERRLAGVRQADERRVGEQLEAELERRAPRRAGPVSAKRGAWRVGEAKRWLPRPPAPPSRHDRARARAREVGQDRAPPRRTPASRRGRASSTSRRRRRACSRRARAAAAGPEPSAALERAQVAQVGVGDEHDVAAAARRRRRPVRPWARASRAGTTRAVAAAARRHVDAGPVVEHAS